MSDLKEKMKQEAIGRMVILNLHPKAINEFKDEGKLNLSLGGFLYWLNEEQTQRVKKFEEETNCLVYHVIQNHMTIGQMLTFLYVSNVEEEWEMERNDLEVGLPIAYVVNVDHDICSEFGSDITHAKNFIKGDYDSYWEKEKRDSNEPR